MTLSVGGRCSVGASKFTASGVFPPAMTPSYRIAMKADQVAPARGHYCREASTVVRPLCLQHYQRGQHAFGAAFPKWTGSIPWQLTR
jgi:hypothetical protein